MPRIKLDYGVKNRIDEYITQEIENRKSVSDTKVYKEALMSEIADYTGVGLENIRRIKKNHAQPSLAVAIKISKFFSVHVEDIFIIDENIEEKVL